MNNYGHHILTKNSGAVSTGDMSASWKTDERDIARVLQVYWSDNRRAHEDLTFEDRLLRETTHGDARLFLFKWSTPVLVLGRSQSMAGIDAGVCRREGISVVRRHTGGTAVLHQRSLNIALILDAQHGWTRRIDTLYAHFTGRVTHALSSIGIHVVAPDHSAQSHPTRATICFETNYGETLLHNGRKVFGCAQRRLKTAVLVHGSLLLGLDAAQQGRVFDTSETHITRTITHVPSDTDETALVDAIIESFSSCLGRTPIRKGDNHGR